MENNSKVKFTQGNKVATFVTAENHWLNYIGLVRLAIQTPDNPFPWEQTLAQLKQFQKASDQAGIAAQFYRRPAHLLAYALQTRIVGEPNNARTIIDQGLAIPELSRTEFNP